jgi:hypothetical protein
MPVRTIATTNSLAEAHAPAHTADPGQAAREQVGPGPIETTGHHAAVFDKGDSNRPAHDAPGAATTRLQPGQLAPLVLAHMQSHPHLDFSPYELAKVLHRSHGTIRRHLLRLALRGEVTRTQSRPARFRITTPI